MNGDMSAAQYLVAAEPVSEQSLQSRTHRQAQVGYYLTLFSLKKLQKKSLPQLKAEPTQNYENQ